MLADTGDTEIDFTTFAVTVSVALPLIPLSEAVIVVDPADTPIASPLELTVAVAELATLQLAEEMTAVEPSLYVAVAVNCCVPLTAMSAEAGATAMVFTVLVTLETLTVALAVIPFSKAVTVVEPADFAVTSPVELIAATA
jgi:hypothetical protein